MKRFLILLLVLGLIAGCTATAQAEPRGSEVFGTTTEGGNAELAKLTASDGMASDRFGIGVAVSGDTALVGAPAEDAQQGAAYVYARVGGAWIEQAKLVASDRLASHKFGYSVALSGDTAVIGSSTAAAAASPVHSHPTPGSAYVFERVGETWIEQAKLTAPDGAYGDDFGSSVAVSGDTVVVGARAIDVGLNPDQGAAYVFARAGGAWTQQAKLTASDGAANDNFGIHVALSGDTAVVGAYFDDVADNANQGSAYVFTESRGMWTQENQLVASDGAADDNFGFWVDVSGDTGVVGAVFDDVNGNANQGSAYVFTQNGGTWPQQEHLVASDGASGDAFGRSVAVSGDTAVVGAQFHDVGGNADQGSAYVFDRTGRTWPERTKLIASDGGAGDLFGVSVAMSGGTAVIGAGFHDVGINVHQGAAYVWKDPSNPHPPLSVTIDVKPRDDTNRIRLSSTRPIPVAVLTTPTFDAATVDPATVCFGDQPPAGGTTSYNQPPEVDADCNEAHGRGHLKDADGDGDLDMVLHFETDETGIDTGDGEARLTGRTMGGVSIEGADSIQTKP
ncbi:MAG: FG-GAP repeat protein [Actinomycetota bacterium]|nr:FG-GAP repeat protein [Actinomycetota bacterium]